MLVVQTETNVFFLDNKIKFCSIVLIFGSRSMVALSTWQAEPSHNK